jgi:hypothetical protein
MRGKDAIEELRQEYRRRASDLALAIRDLADAQGREVLASRDEVRFSDCTVHIMVFVEPKKRKRLAKEGK